MLLICDLDGTLIDSAQRHLALMNDLLTGLQLPPVGREYLQAKRDGAGNRAFLEAHGIGTAEERKQICKAWIEQIETEPYLRMDRWIESRCGEVEKLCQEGARMAVVSARQNESFIRNQVRNRFPVLLDENIRIVDPIRAAEEKKAVVRELYSGETTYFIGDTEVDYESCGDSEVIPYMLNTGFRSEAFWRRRGVESHDSLAELMKMLLTSPAG